MSSSTAVPAPSAPRTARERVREEMTAEILAVAGTHVARDGAAAISLRSIARDLGMAPSALYRYFDGRDALLSALILSAYEALADEAERAADEAEQAAETVRSDSAGRWLAVPRAMRLWALERPHQWGLIFGTPIPGYHAPEDTIEPYTRMARCPGSPAGGGARRGQVPPGRKPRTDHRRVASRRGAGDRGAPSRHVGRDGGVVSSKRSPPSSAPSASRFSGIGATRCSNPACSSTPRSLRRRRRSACTEAHRGRHLEGAVSAERPAASAPLPAALRAGPRGPIRPWSR